MAALPPALHVHSEEKVKLRAKWGIPTESTSSGFGSPPTSIQVIGQNYVTQSLLTVREPRKSVLLGHIPESNKSRKCGVEVKYRLWSQMAWV